jgi:dTDP-4-amino-4,6-dideoxygalactose transaminase
MTAGDATLADHLRMLRVHGSKERYVHEEIGYNSRLDELQAAVLRVKLPRVDSWNAQRAQVARWYGEGLAGLAQVVTPSAPVGYAHIYHQYVIRAERRDELKSFLQDRGIGSMIYYPIPLHQQVCFRFLGYRDGDLPHTERAARDVLALPVFSELRREEVDEVCEGIRAFYSGSR